MRTLAIFENTKDSSKLTVSIEGNAIMYTFENSVYTQYEIVDTVFSEATIVALLTTIDETKMRYDFCVGGEEIFGKYRNRDGETRYSVGNHSYTSMKLLP